ncbi:MAG TPA: DNA gyrase inhibitor YacG [Acidiphilium sp.]|jgi:endogenous inhibitor of DNA gyrase (YacG/DUF329 family)|uniref:DNA gyrase inhibitor YacG n=1 Tax=unclassified Acidiphilium TaxID=2617493 RepID=UPI000BD75590|nr:MULTISPECIES: DNA gyrase inhibitor YacG [unclassified Acidiphilium]OYV55123.1 MAG: DNA gyrase inhibitor YacG [Acidiphilium sp. 20-67-58]OYV82310.1 MAG: DNA gyrase inhibitor YacG [Acidiphilium sp. 21-68-69]HQT61626.1 DNA gyrase inhibitor YacG [Acidiphilium sp.]HQU10921.1 DNA gyrase inhibitor YacG [Acidiphilium sp.]
MTDEKALPSHPRRKPAGACPICGQAAQLAHRPFCSARCRAVDLGRWFSEDYRLPSDEAPFTDSE